jgi:hypothetical protein
METYRILSCLCSPHNSLRSAYHSLCSLLPSLRSPQLVGFAFVTLNRHPASAPDGDDLGKGRPLRLLCLATIASLALREVNSEAEPLIGKTFVYEADSDLNNRHATDNNVRCAVDAVAHWSK